MSVVNATTAAEALGNQKVMNVILLGATVGQMGLTDIDWESIVRKNVPAKLADLNIQAFRKGIEIVS